MPITLKLTGFEEMLTAIEKAGGSIDKAANQCMQKSAKLMDEELKAQMRSANVKSDLINRMPSPEVEMAIDIRHASALLKVSTTRQSRLMHIRLSF